MIWFSQARLNPENNFFLNTSSDFILILVFGLGPLLCVVGEVLINIFAACVNVLFIHLRNTTGLVKKDIALLPFLTSGGRSTANIQDTLFNQNNIKRYKQYGHAGLQLLE